ncbi:MAG: glycosyltransferase family 1 protein, partial [Sphingomonas bacterium]|nr:glycosyltransferase family 1 protein [Sphingomonas bacterium]
EEAKRVSLGRWNLDVRPFVLFVSTIEARKNQVGAVDAWHQLILKHGKDKVPQLVLVGKRGFGSEQALDRVALNPDLTDRVTVLHGATDAELEALYRKCLFTIYPSIYEGWGLPVTESLIHGKVPLTSNNSSLPQAGGGFSVQFDARSNAAFLDALESLIFDAAKREALEKRIVEGFRMRRWADVGNDIFSAVAGWTKIEDGRGKWQPATAQPGYYPLTRNREKRLSPLLDSAEVFRQGGWWRLEDFGSWTKPRGGEIAVRPASLPARMAVELVGIGGEPTPYRVSVAGGGVQFGTLHRNDHKWVFLDLPEGAGPEVRIHIHSQRAATVVDPITEERRELAVGVAGFFLFGEDTIESRFDFVEAVALGSLRDHLFGRSAWPDEGNAG